MRILLLLALLGGCSGEVEVPPEPLPVLTCDTQANGSPCAEDGVADGTCFGGRCTCSDDAHCDDGDPSTSDTCMLTACYHES
jgi:hypothetical protein